MYWLLVALFGCGTSDGVFSGIDEVQISQLSRTGGLTTYSIDPKTELPQVKDCLNTTRPIAEDKLDERLLSQSFLIEVNDRKGKRSFEMLSRRNMRGSDGSYYYNDCIVTFVRQKQGLN